MMKDEAKILRFSKEDTKAIKGIAIIMMVFHHLFAFPDKIPVDYLFDIKLIGGGYLSTEIALIFRLCVAILTFLGGYGTYISFRGKDIVGVLKTLGKKIEKLYIHYWQIFVVFVPILLAFGHIEFNFLELVKNFFALSMSYCSEWWYLKSYLIVTVEFAFLLMILRKFKQKIGMIPCIVIAIIIGEFTIFVLPKVSLASIGMFGRLISAFIVPGLYLLPGFLLGAVSAKFGLLDKIKRKAVHHLAIYAAVSFVAGILILLVRYWDCGNHDYLISFAFVSVQIPIMMFFERKKSIVHKVLLLLGENSMSIWLCHTIICYWLLPQLVYRSRIPAVAFLLTMMFSLLVSIGLRHIFIKLKLFLKYFQNL